jgi:hypothetical protein
VWPSVVGGSLFRLRLCWGKSQATRGRREALVGVDGDRGLGPVFFGVRGAGRRSGAYVWGISAAGCVCVWGVVWVCFCVGMG